MSKLTAPPPPPIEDYSRYLLDRLEQNLRGLCEHANADDLAAVRNLAALLLRERSEARAALHVAQLWIGDVGGEFRNDAYHDAVKQIDAVLAGTSAPGVEPDLHLLRKFADGDGGRRTGLLQRLGYLEWRVTDAGRAALGLPVRAAPDSEQAAKIGDLRRRCAIALFEEGYLEPPHEDECQQGDACECPLMPLAHAVLNNDDMVPVDAAERALAAIDAAAKRAKERQP